MHVLGRSGAVDAGPAARLGSYLARDGSEGAPVGLDVDGPHAGVVVGKRGTGKSYTLGVLAEGLAAADGVAPIVVDPMGVFAGLRSTGGSVVEPVVRPASLPPSTWPDLLGLDPAGAPGSLVWRAVAKAGSGTLGSGTPGPGTPGPGAGSPDSATSPTDAEPLSITRVRELVADSSAPADVRRAADNALGLASSWGVFSPDAPAVTALADAQPTVLDCAGLPPAARGAVVRAVARGLYEARIDGRLRRLPWLLVDEAHVLFDSVAAPALRTLFTRGRAPGVSLVCATQRPHALPDVAVSQADLLLAHRLTAERDVEALRAAQPTYLGADLGATIPAGTGEALIVDDATESAHRVRVRERRTPHGGGSPRASEITSGETAHPGGPTTGAAGEPIAGDTTPAK